MTVRSRKTPRLLTGPLLLEDRAVPATFTATVDPTTNPVGAVTQLRQFFHDANANGAAPDVIDLSPMTGKTYVFNDLASAADGGPFDGGTALPVLTTPGDVVTVNGGPLGVTFLRPAGAPSFRFLRAVGQVDAASISPGIPPSPPPPAVGPTLVLNNLALQGGNVYDYSLPNLIDDASPCSTAGPCGWTTPT